MRFSYRIVRDRSGFVAECVESEAAGEGKTEEAAVAALRRSLEERMFRPDAVAPPSHQPRAEIDLVLADESIERRSIDLGGPGDAPVPR